MPFAETAPDLASEYDLSADQIASYRKRGHVLLREVAVAAEIDFYRPAISAAVDRFNTETRPLEERDFYSRAFLQVINLWHRDETVRRFTFARRFAKIAAELMGVDGVRIFHDQALYKEPGGSPTAWHQDQFHWPLDTNNTITLWMPLVNIPDEVGSMTFGSGTHVLGYLGDLGISEESDRVLAELIRERGITAAKGPGMSAGDATYHSGWTLHSAPGNPTASMREVMTVIYFADGARVSEPENGAQWGDLRQWLPGCEPGDPAASELNPRVYPT